MTTLIEFLRTRYDEEQRDAEAAYDGDGYREWDIPCTGVVQVAGGDLDGLVVAPRAAAIHIASHDPARVLAEVAAKRAIVDAYDQAGQSWQEAIVSRDVDSLPVRTARLIALEFAARQLAAPFADHPDYDPAWQPAPMPLMLRWSTPRLIIGESGRPAQRRAPGWG
jgi:hypothetical protein